MPPEVGARVEGIEGQHFEVGLADGSHALVAAYGVETFRLIPVVLPDPLAIGAAPGAGPQVAGECQHAADLFEHRSRGAVHPAEAGGEGVTDASAPIGLTGLVAFRGKGVIGAGRSRRWSLPQRSGVAELYFEDLCGFEHRFFFRAHRRADGPLDGIGNAFLRLIEWISGWGLVVSHGRPLFDCYGQLTYLRVASLLALSWQLEVRRRFPRLPAVTQQLQSSSTTTYFDPRPVAVVSPPQVACQAPERLASGVFS